MMILSKNWLKFKLHFARQRSSSENIFKAVIERVLEVKSLALALKIKSLLTTLLGTGLS